MVLSNPPVDPWFTEWARMAAASLGFRFRNPSVFGRALVHRSYCNEHGLAAEESYERLEFLGDAVLELVISERLFREFGAADEGQLTKWRASLVQRKTLAAVARRLNLGDHLLVGRGVETSGGREQESILAAALESVIAAIYLEHGLDTVSRFIHENLATDWARIGREDASVENPKSRLQELLQGLGDPTPSYRLVSQEGPDHNPQFCVEVVVGETTLASGRGGRKSDAERAAAERALGILLNGDQKMAGVESASPATSYGRTDTD